RLEAEAAGAQTLEFNEAFAEFRDNLKKSEQQTFQGRRLKLDSGLALLRDQVNQRALDIKQLETERDSITKNLGLLQEKLKISRDLVKDQLTSKLEHLQLEAEVKELEGRLEVVKVAIPRSHAAMEESEERLRNEELSFRNLAQEELSGVEMEISQTQEQLS